MKKTLLAMALSQIVTIPVYAGNLWEVSSQAKTFEHRLAKHYRLEHTELESKLMAANSDVDIQLPLPNGEFVLFRLSPSQVMSKSLAEKFPNIKTFIGYELANPSNTGRFDLGPKGFYGVFNQGNTRIFIDPERTENLYKSYAKQSESERMHIKQASPIKRLNNSMLNRDLMQFAQTQVESNTLPNSHITYRIAFATTGEYAQYHGGTKETVMAALVTMVNRLNDVYERDLAMQFELVADNDKLIFLDPETDPFANTDEDIDILSEKINGLIGEDSYDIGHLVGTGGGGLAGFEVVCTEYKAEGITGSEAPTNDAFHIDYVAHEIGHQLGADHTFNGQAGACTGNRAENSAYEPGSGSTIMGYTGICDEQDLQANSDPYFHIHSLDQMNKFSRQGAGKTCGLHKERENTKPTVEAGESFTIPARTAFKLMGTAQDKEGDVLSYSWQQFNLGPASADKQQDSVDDGKRPLFRTFNPTSEPIRVVPQMQDLLKGELSYGEAFATTSRVLDFRLVVRDNKGGVNDDTMQVNVIENEKGFSVTLPDASSVWRDNKQLIEWHTAGTENAPVSCQKVDIFLSEDGGQNFKTEIAKRIDNNGQYTAELKTINTAQARLQIKCSDNIFFAINSGNFTIQVGDGADSEVAPKITGQNVLTINEDSQLTIKLADLKFATDKAVDSLALQSGENYTFNNTTLVPKADYHGVLKVPVTVTRGKLTSEPYSLQITITPVNDAPEAANDSFEVDYAAKDVELNILQNDTDKDGDTVQIEAVDYRGKGAAVIKDGKLVYSAPADFSGEEVFKYTITDGTGGSNFAVITIKVKENPNPEPDKGDEKDDSGSLGFISMLGLFALLTRRIRKG